MNRRAQVSDCAAIGSQRVETVKSGDASSENSPPLDECPQRDRLVNGPGRALGRGGVTLDVESYAQHHPHANSRFFNK